MSYLVTAFFGEGPTDERFLPPVLQRLTEELCRWYARGLVEVGAVLRLSPPQEFRDADRATKILEAARRAEHEFDVLFVHADGATYPARVRSEQVQPAITLIRQQLHGGSERSVGIIPVRMTEAWALADGDALRGSFGTQLNDEDLGLPARARDVERLRNPKETLEKIYEKISGSGRPKRKASDFLEVIAERVNLSHLREVPSFRRAEEDLRQILSLLNYLHPP